MMQILEYFFVGEILKFFLLGYFVLSIVFC